MSQTIPQHVLHGALGTLLIGTWINTGLFSLELTQVYRYYVANPLWQLRSSSRTSSSSGGRRPDPAWIRILVLWMLVLDIVATGVGCAMAYTYTVTGWGDVNVLQSNDWLMAFFGITSAFSILSMHLFLISRYYVVTRATIVSSILALLAVTACGLYVFLATSLITLFRQLSDRPKMRPVVIAWIVDSTLTDWFIACTLMWFLYKIKSEVDDSRGSVRMITRLMHVSALSGAAPALIALLTFIGYLASTETNLGFMFSLSGGRAATLTVLYGLNSRNGLMPSTQSSSDAATSIYIGSTVEPRQMFGGGVDTWATTRTGQDRVILGTGQATNGDDSFASLGDYDSKPAIDLESTAGNKSRRVSIVRMSLPKSSLPTLEGGTDPELSMSSQEADTKSRL